jgi:hypothetical protein
VGQISPWNLIRYVGLVAVAIVEALNEAVLRLPKEFGLPEWLTSGFWHFVPIILLILLGIANFLGLALWGRKAKLQLEILAPINGSGVDLMRTVRGAATQAGVPIQLLVFAGDKRWHPQRRATVDGRAWSAECQFGNAERGSGEHYRVVAISTALPLTNPAEELPAKCVKSQIVTVVRPSS